MAEEEGMALQSRKGKADDLTITISKSTSVSFSICYQTYVSVSPRLHSVLNGNIFFL